MNNVVKTILGAIVVFVIIAGVLSLPPRDTSPENDYGILRR